LREWAYEDHSSPRNNFVQRLLKTRYIMEKISCGRLASSTDATMALYPCVGMAHPIIMVSDDALPMPSCHRDEKPLVP
jgi:hypothetical protein